jgi:hypothetical protein
VRRADLVGTVSHRPFPGLPDGVGMARETRALPEGGQQGPGGPLAEGRGREACRSGRDGVSPSVPWAAGRGGDGPRDSSPTGGRAAARSPLMEIRARRVVCLPPRLASAESRCRVCVVKFWQFASGWGSKKGQGLVVRSRLSQLSGSSGGRAISPKAPRLARPVLRSKPYRERRWVGRGLSWAAILGADEVEGDGVAS